jgi:hypothetical protein
MTLVDYMGRLEIIMPTRLLFRALVAVVQAGFGHAFSKASLFDEFFLQRLQLLIQQIIRLMNQADRDVDNHLRRTSFHELTIQFKRLRCLPSEVADKQGFFGILVPNGKIADSQVITKIGQQFFAESVFGRFGTKINKFLKDGCVGDS